VLVRLENALAKDDATLERTQRPEQGVVIDCLTFAPMRLPGATLLGTRGAPVPRHGCSPQGMDVARAAHMTLSPARMGRRVRAPERRTPVRHRRVLVTGCGRSGTTYVSLLLRKCGLHVPHEHRMGRDGISSWLFGVESTTVPWGPSPSKFRFENVVHLVRDPLSSIPSIATFKPSAWAYISRHIPIDAREPLLVRSATYWLRWNEIIERRAESRVRVEDLPVALEPLCMRMGSPRPLAAVQPIRRDLNTRRHGRLFASIEDRCLRVSLVPTFFKALLAKRTPSFRDVTWADLQELDPSLAASVHHKAREYGYRYAREPT
jgi:hypothetical protein